MDEQEEQGIRKETVEVGSGDFQSNPIYGDQPQSYNASTYEDESNLNAQPAEFNYAAQQQQPQQQQEYGADEAQQQGAPPPYSQDAPPPAYANDTPQTYGNGHAQEEPQDVVAELNQDEDVGDYGVSQPKVDDTTSDTQNGEGFFGNFYWRQLTMSGVLIWTSIMGMALWFQSTKNFLDYEKTAWGLSGFAIFFIFLGSVLGFIYVLLQKLGRPIPIIPENIAMWIVFGLYMIGGIFYFFGGCAVAYAFNQYGISLFSSIGSFFFAEMTFVALHTILTGVDLWKKEILNDKKKRVIIYNVLYFLAALVLFFAYAITSTNIDDLGGDNAGPAWLALFYFLAMIPLVLFMIIYLIPKLRTTFGTKPIINLILAGSFAVCVVCILIGYFILTGDFLELEGRAYFLGVGVFMLVTGTQIAFDMMFDKFIPGYKDGGNSVTDQQAQGVPTQNPDSDD